MSGIEESLGRTAERPTRGLVARLQWCRDAVVGVRGWRRSLVAILLGALAVVALPPIYAWPALIPAFSGLYWLIDPGNASRRSAFFAGWWFGFGFFVAGLYWIFNAFLVRAEQFGWMAPFAVAGLAAGLAVFPALACLATRAVRATGVGGVLVFAAVWTAFEWIRGVVLTGFPWNLVGTAWGASDAMIQAASVLGTLGLGLLTVTAAAMPATLADRSMPQRWSLAASVLAWLVMAGVWAGGAAHLARIGPTEAVDGVRLRLVQPSIPQHLKWRPRLLDTHLRQQLALGASPSETPPTHVIWSEAAAPLFLEDDPARRAWIGTFTPPGGATILGTLRKSGDPGAVRLHNSLLAIDDTGAVRATYDKAHLVPFGEYVPFRDLLRVTKLTEGTIDYSPGPGLTTLRLPGLPPVGPLICYEVIFPGRVVAPDERPEWLLNVTNDGWYGRSAGPYQHFAAARMRAVEEGLPLVRVANTGISAVIDAHGRVVAKLGLGAVGILDAPLPVRQDGLTPYARFGDGIVLVMIGFIGVIGWLGMLRQPRS